MEPRLYTHKTTKQIRKTYWSYHNDCIAHRAWFSCETRCFGLVQYTSSGNWKRHRSNNGVAMRLISNAVIDIPPIKMSSKLEAGWPAW